MKRLTPWLAPLLALALGVMYLLIPKFSLEVNQVCEMLATGNTQGLMMFFHSAGPQGPLISLGIGLLAFLVPFLKPVYLLKANVLFYGLIYGGLLTFLSGLLALTALMLLGYSTLALLPDRIRTRLKAVPRMRYYLLLACTTWMLTRLN